MPFGQLNVAIQIHNICKGRLGSRGAKGLYKRKKTSNIWSFLLYINCINSFTVNSVIGRLVPLFNGLVPMYVTE